MLKKIFTNPIIFIGLGHAVADFGSGAIPVMIPYLKEAFGLSYSQVGLIFFLNNLTASVIQPLFGYLTDKRSLPWLLPLCAALVGICLGLSGHATSYNLYLLAIIITGVACAAFHPQASRSVRLLSELHNRGKNMGYFLVFGNGGMAIGSLAMTAFLTLSGDMKNSIYFAIPGVLVALLLYFNMDKITISEVLPTTQSAVSSKSSLPFKSLLLVLTFIFIRSTTHAGIAAYIPLYYITMGMDKTLASSLLSIYLIAGAMGTLFGGNLSDKLSRKQVIVGSMLIIIPMLYLMPRTAGLPAAALLAVTGFFFLASFGPTVLIAQDLMPNYIGLASGLSIGLSVGLGGCGVLALGTLADYIGLEAILKFLAIMPLLAALLAMMFPKENK